MDQRTGSGSWCAKKVYLLVYNVTMFMTFLGVHVSLLRNMFSEKPNEIILHNVTDVVQALTYIQLMEVVHPIMGITPGGAFLPFIQVSGRLVVNQMLVDRHVWRNSAPFVNYLFIAWSCIEIVRYSFYALRLLNVDIYPIKWARYTLFLPLYPMGAFCESQVLLTAAKRLEETGAYSFGLPNPANVSFHAPTFLKIYVYLLLGPAVIYLMRYMCSQRKKQLRAKVE